MRHRRNKFYKFHIWCYFDNPHYIIFTARRNNGREVDARRAVWIKYPEIMTESLKTKLKALARRYETASFLEGDPSKFMHLMKSEADMEAAAFTASALSFGSRAQFLPKISHILDAAEGRPDEWIRTGAFKKTFRPNDKSCFYRFFTRGDMYSFFRAYANVMRSHGTLGGFVKSACGGDGGEAVKTICRRFSQEGSTGVIPKDGSSACKRVCMFLRWMVRSGSPVDLGLWADFIDRRTLVIPLDTHVLQHAKKLGLIKSACSSMASARRLTAALAEVFPDDPVRGDFALFGHDVNAGGNAD